MGISEVNRMKSSGWKMMEKKRGKREGEVMLKSM